MIKIKGLTIHRSYRPVEETINVLQTYLQQHGATIYARIDQQAEGVKAGLTLLPLQFLLFGNPKSGVPIMLQNPLAALDLPLKIIAWEDKRKRVWIAYNKMGYLKKRYSLTISPKGKLDIDGWVNDALGNKNAKKKAQKILNTNTD